MRNDFDIKTLIGLTEEKATEVAGWNGYTVRVMQKDGESYFGTADMKWNRINLHIENNLVTNTSIG